MNELELTTRIAAPPDVVFATITDVSKIPVWTPGLLEVRSDDGGPLAVGSRMTFVGKFLGWGYETPVECTALDPGARFATESRAGPFHLDVDQTVSGDGDETVLVCRYRGDSHTFFKLAEPVVFNLARRMFQSANENLKALLEGGAI